MSVEHNNIVYFLQRTSCPLGYEYWIIYDVSLCGLDEQSSDWWSSENGRWWVSDMTRYQNKIPYMLSMIIRLTYTRLVSL